MSELDFHKMHGLGNDFVIVDQRSGKLSLSPAQMGLIADRRHGVGFDQLLCLEPSESADVFMRVFNPDGSEAGACGNGTRCVARLMMEEFGQSHVSIETSADVLEVTAGLKGYTVDMGKPGQSWDEIPLARAMDTLVLDLEAGSLSQPTAVSMGNPHAVFFVDDAQQCLWTSSARISNGTRSFQNERISALPRCRIAAPSGFGSSSAGRGSRPLAAVVPAPPWSPPSGVVLRTIPPMSSLTAGVYASPGGRMAGSR